QFDALCFACLVYGVVVALTGSSLLLALRLRVLTSYLMTRVDLSTASAHKTTLYLCVLLFPKATWYCCMWFWTMYIIGFAITKMLPELLGIHSRTGLVLFLRKTRKLKSAMMRLFKRVVVWACGENGWFAYNHIDGDLGLDWENQEPYFPFETLLVQETDKAHNLACGDTLRGLPVFARRGDEILAGVGKLPAGWQLT
nr:nonstructural protein NS2 [Norway rat hepacivirus 2]